MSSHKASATKKHRKFASVAPSATIDLTQSADGKTSRVASLKSSNDNEVECLGTMKPPARRKSAGDDDDSDVEILGVFKPFSSGNNDRKPAARRKRVAEQCSLDSKKQSPKIREFSNPYKTWGVECLGSQPAQNPFSGNGD